MITVTCDMCGEKVNSFTNEVDLEFAYEGVPSLAIGGFQPRRKQLCITCAKKLIDYIENKEMI